MREAFEARFWAVVQKTSGHDRQINLNWHLISGLKPVLECAVLHDMCHLKHRSHEPEFWNLVQRILPDWEARKAWLDKNEHMLGWEKVELQNGS